MNPLLRSFSKEANCVTRTIAGETIIVPIRGRVGDLDSVFTLNEVGTTIWQLIDGRTSVKQIVETVHETYQVGRQEAERDTIEFLKSLEEVGLIHPKEG